MQTGSAIVLTSLLSCALTAVVLEFLPGRDAQAKEAPRSGPALLGEEGMAERLDELERKLAALESLPAAQPVRQAKGVERAEIERLIRELMGKEGASEQAGDRVDEVLPDFDLERSFGELLEAGLDYDERKAIFQRAKKAGQIDALIAKLRKRAEENPAIAQAQLELGQAYLEKVEGMPPGPEAGFLANAADKAFDNALAADPKHWEARFVKAISLSFWPPMFGKKAEAISNFETLLEQQKTGPQKPEYAETYRLLGNLYSEQGKAEEARKIWEEGLRRFPQDEDLRKRLR